MYCIIILLLHRADAFVTDDFDEYPHIDSSVE